MNRYAVIDLGTNTFHLLIVESLSKVVFRERQFVKLAEDGIQTIGDAAFKRALKTMLHFHSLLEAYEVKKVQAFGTAGLRTASNGSAFIEQVAEKTGIEIQLISGDREALLIQKGVAQAIPMSDENALIMDIGGGSVEFIIANQQQVWWAQSFPIGVAVLYNEFQQNDPISVAEIDTLKTFLQQTLQPLDDALKRFETMYLVGASGTFDVLEENLAKLEEGQHHSMVSTDHYFDYHDFLLTTTIAQRLTMPNIPNDRAELLIVAFILIEIVLKKLSTDRIVISRFAMKEGMLTEMI